VFGADLVYSASGAGVHALDATSGRLRWSRDVGAPVVGTPLLAGGVLHLATGGGQLHALDAGTGEPRWDLTVDEPTSWSAEFPGEYAEVAAPLTLADGVLYAATDTGVLALA
jgi:outer membrane protein assembly factor BamB